MGLSEQDIFKQATEDRLTSAKELPYFEGDFWPNVLEESIKELEQEEEERKREENSTSNESIDVRSVGVESACAAEPVSRLFQLYSLFCAGHKRRQQKRKEEKQQKDQQEQEQPEPSQ